MGVMPYFLQTGLPRSTKSSDCRRVKRQAQGNRKKKKKSLEATLSELGNHEPIKPGMMRWARKYQSR